MNTSPSNISNHPSYMGPERIILTGLAGAAAVAALAAGTIALLNYFQVPLTELTISGAVIGGSLALFAIVAIAQKCLRDKNITTSLQKAAVYLKDGIFFIGLTAFVVGIVGLWKYSQLSLSNWQVASIFLGGGLAILGASYAINHYIQKKHIDSLAQAAATTVVVPATASATPHGLGSGGGGGGGYSGGPSLVQPIPAPASAPAPTPASGVGGGGGGGGATVSADPWHDVVPLFGGRTNDFRNLQRNDPQIRQYLESMYPYDARVQRYVADYFDFEQQNPNNANASAGSGTGTGRTGAAAVGGGAGAATGVGGGAGYNPDPL